MRRSIFIAFALLTACDEEVPTSTGSAPHQLQAPSFVLSTSVEPALFRVVDADVHGDTLYLAELSTNTVRRFDLTARVELPSLGGSGDGPGEFRRLQWVTARPGQLLAYDGQLGRLTSFDIFTGETESRTLDGRVDGLISPGMVGVLANDDIVGAAFPSDYERVREGVSRTPTLLLGFSPAGALVDTLGQFVGAEIFRAPFGEVGDMSTPLLFGRAPFLSVADDQGLLVGNEYAEVELFAGISGRSDTISPGRRVTRRSVASEAVERQSSRNRSASTIPGTSGLFEAMPIPDSMPYYGTSSRKRISAAHLTDAGEIWLLPYRTPEDPEWVWIFGRDGMPWDAISLPPESNILHIGDRYLVLQRWDDLEVEIIEVHDRSEW